MLYTIIIVLLLALSLIYFKIADKYNIVDKPNERSSHTAVTLRGGGIIFWFAALFYFLLHIKTNYLFFAGITLVSFISFYDDIKSLSNRVRSIIQFVSISIIFYDLSIFTLFPWWLILITYIVFIGIVNAYNFMDGINGITGIYSLSVLGALIYVNQYVVINFIEIDFIVFPSLACLVFLYFNYRKKAKCFAGDIGSISIAFWIIYVLLMLIIKTDSIVWILFLSVYGVDSICTILHRIYLKQNIFKAHRLHFYQILCNEKKIDHRFVSLLYGILQLVVSSFVIFCFENGIGAVPTFMVTIVPLILIYSIKFILLKESKI